MPFQRPTLPDLIDRAASDIESRLPGTDARLRRSNLNVLARMHAGAVHGLYGMLDWLSRQVLPDSAEAEYLARWASIWGVSRLAAVAATGSITLTGATGSVVPAGTVLQRSDGALFATTAEVAFTTTTASASVTAQVAGATGNTAANTTLSLVSPISGVQSSAVVASGGLTGGVDSETDERLRARLLARIQAPPQGGNTTDYAQWARAVAGVTRVWVFPGWLGIGTVGVGFVMDDAPGSIIPDAATVTKVADYIDPRRPVTADVTVFAPTAAPQAMTIRLSPNTTTVQAAVTAELNDLFRREAQVEDGTGSGKILLSRINEAISIASGETDHVLVSPTADITLTKGQIATLGVITWQ